MKNIYCYILRLVYKNQAYKVNKHPVYNIELLSEITISNKKYYYIGNYMFLKCKN